MCSEFVYCVCDCECVCNLKYPTCEESEEADDVRKLQPPKNRPTQQPRHARGGGAPAGTIRYCQEVLNSWIATITSTCRCTSRMHTTVNMPAAVLHMVNAFLVSALAWLARLGYLPRAASVKHQRNDARFGMAELTQSKDAPETVSTVFRNHVKALIHRRQQLPGDGGRVFVGHPPQRFELSFGGLAGTAAALFASRPRAALGIHKVLMRQSGSAADGSCSESEEFAARSVASMLQPMAAHTPNEAVIDAAARGASILLSGFDSHQPQMIFLLDPVSFFPAAIVCMHNAHGVCLPHKKQHCRHSTSPFVT